MDPEFWSLANFTVQIGLLIATLLVVLVTYLISRQKPRRIECKELPQSSVSFDRLGLRVSPKLEYDGHPTHTQFSVTKLSFRNKGGVRDEVEKVQLQVITRGPQQLIGIEPGNPLRITTSTALPAVDNIANLEINFLNPYRLEKEELDCTLVFDGPIESVKVTISSPAGWALKFRSIDSQRARLFGKDILLALCMAMPLFLGLPNGLLHGFEWLTFPVALITITIWTTVAVPLIVVLGLGHRRDDAFRTIRSVGITFMNKWNQWWRKR